MLRPREEQTLPRFAANLSMMFQEIEAPVDRFRAARDAGFTAVEYLRPFNHSIAEVRQW
jgi:hydroxypyruvate isomerase